MYASDERRTTKIYIKTAPFRYFGSTNGGDPSISHDTLFVEDFVNSYPTPTQQLLALKATTGELLWAAQATGGGTGFLLATGGNILTRALADPNTIVYSTNDGSVIGAASGTPGRDRCGRRRLHDASSGMAH